MLGSGLILNLFNKYRHRFSVKPKVTWQCSPRKIDGPLKTRLGAEKLMIISVVN